MEKSKAPSSPYDINGTNFNPDMYLQKLVKEHTLNEIMEQEEKIVHDTQCLHSEMQTLVYENYNKFISATDTIRKMKSDFKQMETEMDLLGKNMDSITSFSDQISNTLQDSRMQISKLSGVHSLLKRLQFLFKLPQKLKTLMEEKNFTQAVEDYLHTQQILDHYAHLESFRGIQEDCKKIVEELKDNLHSQFQSKQATAKELTQSVELLLMLGEPAINLYEEFLIHAGNRLKDHIDILESENSGQDLIEFVDMANKGFLNDLCLIVTSYNEMFVKNINQRDDMDGAEDNLIVFINERIDDLMRCVENRILKEQDKNDTPVLVRALDRFYSSLNTVNALFTHIQLSRRGLDLVMRSAKRQCEQQKESMESQLAEWVRSVRQSIAQEHSQPGELLTTLVINTVEKVKGALNDLTLFIQPEVSFACDKTFFETFCVESIREELCVGFIRHIIQMCKTFTAATSCPSLPTLLVLAKMCLEFSSIHINHLLGLVDDWFNVTSTKEHSAEKELLCKDMHSAAQDLINLYVRMQGNTISQMLRKSVETRDWVHSLEPRTVRPVMKRVLENLAAIETQVGALFEEGSRPEPGSDSSRRTKHRSMTGTSWPRYSPHTAQLHKIFSEKIEVFAPVDFTKVSMMTGIIKISLKTLLECIRLRTFNQFGLQQIQVDVHYLQLYLWRYVSDENLVQRLLDDILESAAQRCFNLQLMDPSIVDIICERN